MSDEDTDPDNDSGTVDLERVLGDMESTMDELEAILAGEDEAMGAISDYLTSDGSPEDGVDALLEWVRANTDADIDMIESAATDYLAESEAEDLGETPVAEFQAWLESRAEGGEEEPEEPEEQEVTMEDLNAVKETVGQVAGALGDIKDMLSSREDQITDRFDDLERRLSGIEDEPVKRSLTGETPGEFFEGDGDESGATAHNDVFL